MDVADLRNNVMLSFKDLILVDSVCGEMQSEEANDSAAATHSMREESISIHSPIAASTGSATKDDTVAGAVGNASLSLASTFPGIEDYNQLKYMQLRYLFTEHVFLDVTWKAMQAAGWTYGGGAHYQSPRGTRRWSNNNEILSDLDRYAVKPILSNLQILSQNEEIASKEYDCDLESILDLRNDLCYHILLLIEAHRRGHRTGSEDTDDDETIGENKTRDVSLEEEDSDEHETNKPKQRQLGGIATRLRKRTNTAPDNVLPSTSSISTATAIEKGAELYLHKKGRVVASKKKQAAMKNAAAVALGRAASVAAMPFPTIPESMNLLTTTFSGQDENKQGPSAEHVSSLDEDDELAMFAQWRHYLTTNHSLLLYGHGSKYKLLQRFGDVELSKEGYVLEVDGFDPDVTIDGLLSLVVTLFLDGREPKPHKSQALAPHSTSNSTTYGETAFHDDASSTTPTNRAVAIAGALCRQCQVAKAVFHPIFVVIHCLDGPGLCTDEAQQALAALATHSVPRDTSPVAIVRIVVSMAHVDAPSALWTTATSARFAWIWQQAHTYQPYIHELTMLEDEEDAKKKNSRPKQHQQPSALQEARVEEILRALIPKYGEVMQMLAKLQIEALNGTTAASSNNLSAAALAISRSGWVSFADLRTACKAKFILDKDTKLRGLMSELSDHKMIVSQTEAQSEWVRIPFGLAKLKDIAAYKR